MQKIVIFLFILFYFFSSFIHAKTLPTPIVAAKSWMLLDATSNMIIASVNPDDRIEPASLAKIMTAYLVFEALKLKQLTLDQKVNVPVQAWKIDPSSSKMFIEPNTQVSIHNLLHGLIISSGNDAAIALAQAVAGTTESFVALMNHEATRMGLKNTHFGNPHGLPDENTYSTARDIATLARRYAMDYPEYTNIDAIKSFTYNSIKQYNRNRLLWLDNTVDGLKTGHTSSAGYSIVATAKRPFKMLGTTSHTDQTPTRRLIAVVIGTHSDQARTQEALKLLNWGYKNFSIVRMYVKNQIIATPQVWKGSRNQIDIGFAEDVYITVQKDMTDKVQVMLERTNLLLAPIMKGHPVGTMKITLEETILSELPVIALETVHGASFFGQIWDSARLWVKNKVGF